MQYSWTIILSLLFFLPLTAQKSQRIDELFNDWTTPHHPGGVVRVEQAEKIIYSKAFGLANLQYEVPHTEASVFNLGSVSKQFTAMGIVLLEQSGKLSFDDSIGRFLPEMKTTSITIRQLLHHTSGLRSTPEMFALAGWRAGDVISMEDDFLFLSRQEELNFVPGTRFGYSNSNYVALAIIISRVTGKDFAEWMQETIFQPLGLTHTFVNAANQSINRNCATPYQQSDENHFEPARNENHDLGASNVYSNVEDMQRWLGYFKNPPAEWAAAFGSLTTLDTLSNGAENTYAFGVIVDEYHGHRRISHAGGVPGFLSWALCFPALDLKVVVLTNYLDPHFDERLEQLISLYIDQKAEKPMEMPTLRKKPVEATAIKSFSADYWNDEDNYARKVYGANDTLWYARTNGMRSALLQVEDSLFILGGISTPVYVRFSSDQGKKTMYVKDGEKPEVVFQAYDATAPGAKEIRAYTGNFYSAELETNYRIYWEEGQLIGYHGRHGYFGIDLLKKDVTNWSGMAVAKYVYNSQQEVIGLFLTMDRVHNVWFQKIE